VTFVVWSKSKMYTSPIGCLSNHLKYLSSEAYGIHSLHRVATCVAMLATFNEGK